MARCLAISFVLQNMMAGVVLRRCNQIEGDRIIIPSFVQHDQFFFIVGVNGFDLNCCFECFDRYFNRRPLWTKPFTFQWVLFHRFYLLLGRMLRSFQDRKLTENPVAGKGFWRESFISRKVAKTQRNQVFFPRLCGLSEERAGEKINSQYA